MIIRLEQLSDIPAIYEINRQAFKTTFEAELVNCLRDADVLILSLVAVEKDRPVGHISFSPVNIIPPSFPLIHPLPFDGGEETGRGKEAVGLAPMAVLTEFQKKGIGSRLVNEGLRLLKEAGHEIVVVLGHPWYYPRFGFVPASRYGIRWEHDAQDEAFMIKELTPGALEGISGIVHFRSEFEESESQRVGK